MAASIKTSGKKHTIRPVDRQRMSSWLLKHLDSKEVPGLRWLPERPGEFRIKWPHQSRHGWSLDDAKLFELWAKHTGRYDERSEDPKKWKANFRCALNSLKDIREVKNRTAKGPNAFKVFRFVDKAFRTTMCQRERFRSNSETSSMHELATVDIGRDQDLTPSPSMEQSPIPDTVLTPTSPTPPITHFTRSSNNIWPNVSSVDTSLPQLPIMETRFPNAPSTYTPLKHTSSTNTSLMLTSVISTPAVQLSTANTPLTHTSATDTPLTRTSTMTTQLPNLSAKDAHLTRVSNANTHLTSLPSSSTSSLNTSVGLTVGIKPALSTAQQSLPKFDKIFPGLGHFEFGKMHRMPLHNSGFKVFPGDKKPETVKQIHFPFTLSNISLPGNDVISTSQTPTPEPTECSSDESDNVELFFIEVDDETPSSVPEGTILFLIKDINGSLEVQRGDDDIYQRDDDTTSRTCGDVQHDNSIVQSHDDVILGDCDIIMHPNGDATIHPNDDFMCQQSQHYGVDVMDIIDDDAFRPLTPPDSN